MSASDATQRLEHEQYDHSDIYTGSAEDLISAGLITADQLPGAPGRNKSCCTFMDGGAPVTQGSHHTRDERYLQIRRISKQKFQVWKGVSAEEEKRRYAARAAADQRDRDLAKWRERQALRQRRTPEEYRERCVRFVEIVREIIMDDPFGEGMYTVTGEDRTELEELIGELRDVLSTAEIVKVADPTVAEATSDAAFQEFLTAQGLREPV